jgi:hypothetical protein
MGWLQVTLAEKEFFRSEAILHDLLPSSVVQQMTEDPTKRQLFQAAADTTSLALHVPRRTSFHESLRSSDKTSQDYCVTQLLHTAGAPRRRHPS